MIAYLWVTANARRRLRYASTVPCGDTAVGRPPTHVSKGGCATLVVLQRTAAVLEAHHSS